MCVLVSASVCFCLQTCSIPDRQHIQKKMDDFLHLFATLTFFILPIVIDKFHRLVCNGQIQKGRDVTERTELYWYPQQRGNCATQRLKTESF